MSTYPEWIVSYKPKLKLITIQHLVFHKCRFLLRFEISFWLLKEVASHALVVTHDQGWSALYQVIQGSPAVT